VFWTRLSVYLFSVQQRRRTSVTGKTHRSTSLLAPRVPTTSYTASKLLGHWTPKT